MRNEKFLQTVADVYRERAHKDFEAEKRGAALIREMLVAVLDVRKGRRLDLDTFRRLLKLSIYTQIETRIALLHECGVTKAKANDLKRKIERFNKKYKRNPSHVGISAQRANWEAVKLDRHTREFLARTHKLLLRLRENLSVQEAREAYADAYLDIQRPKGLTARKLCPILYAMQPQAFPLVNGWVADGIAKLAPGDSGNIRDYHKKILEPLSDACHKARLPAHFGALDRTLGALRNPPPLGFSHEVEMRLEKLYTQFAAEMSDDAVQSFENDEEFPEDFWDNAGIMQDFIRRSGVASLFDTEALATVWTNRRIWKRLPEDGWGAVKKLFTQLLDAVEPRPKVSLLSQVLYFASFFLEWKNGATPLRDDTLAFLRKEFRRLDRWSLDEAVANFLEENGWPKTGTEEVTDRVICERFTWWAEYKKENYEEIPYLRMTQFAEWWKGPPKQDVQPDPNPIIRPDPPEDRFEDDALLYTAKEGRPVLREHLERERSASLVAAFKASLKSYKCRICGFDFEECYGRLGAEFIEAHHTKPISTLSKNEEVDVRDLVAVCSNCHRMIHRRSPAIDWKMVKVRKNSAVISSWP